MSKIKALTDTQKEVKKQADYIINVGAEVTVNKISRAISHIDSSRIARNAGDIGSAESALSNARALLIEILGIKEY